MASANTTHTVYLALTADEAQVVCDLTAAVGGSGPSRDNADNVRAALLDAGVDYRSIDDPDYPFVRPSHITFKEGV